MPNHQNPSFQFRKLYKQDIYSFGISFQDKTNQPLYFYYSTA